MKLKLTNLVLAIGISSALVGAAYAADTVPRGAMSKKITLKAEIADSIFVSKPDGSTWYDTESLDAVDSTQKKFTKKLPIRVLTKNNELNVSLMQPLRLANGYGYEMANPKITLSDSTGDKEIKFGSVQKIAQVTKAGAQFDDIHNLTIDVDAPDGITAGSYGLGSYSGDLVLLFEPIAAAEGGK